MKDVKLPKGLPGKLSRIQRRIPQIMLDRMVVEVDSTCSSISSNPLSLTSLNRFAAAAAR